LEDKAKNEKDWEQTKLFVHEVRGKVFTPKIVDTKISQQEFADMGFEEDLDSNEFDDVNIGEGSVIRSFESMLYDFDIVGWCATQGNRSSVSSDVVRLDQIGGSIKKAQVGHLVISISKSLQQKELGLATIAILKSRFGRDGIVFENCTFDNSRMYIDTSKKNIITTFDYENEKSDGESSTNSNHAPQGSCRT